MTITYKGKQEPFYPAQVQKLEAKFNKLGKILDGKGEKTTRVILSSHRSLHKAEVTVNYLHHSLVGEGKDADQFTALNAALDKLEKQVLKVRAKRQEVKTGPKDGWNKELQVAKSASAATPLEPRRAKAAAEAAPQRKSKIFRVNPANGHKPMTLEEAMLEVNIAGDYVVYRDADRDCLSVLLRRKDGHFDLIEG